MRFLAMYYEASGKKEKAQEIYLEILEQSPDDAATFKRLVSLHRYNDLPNDAIAMLNKYIQIH